MMKTHVFFISAVLMMCALLSSCGNDNNPVAPPTQNSPYTFYDLSKEWHVLANIESAYNARKIEKYDQLLDDNFTFFLYHGDVGGSIPASWDRATEVLYNSRLFDKSYPTNTCKSISMDLLFNPETIPWSDFTPDQNQYPGETWKQAVIYYTFRFEILPNTQYESVAGSRALFTVRNVGTDQAPKWRLVEMDDLGDGNLMALAIAGGVHDTTWGQVKALYR